MRASRNSDLREVHDRPDDWWARVNWDYDHKTQAERVEDGRRNLAVILIILFFLIVAAWTTFFVVTVGAVGFVFAIGIPLRLWNRAPKR